MTFPRGTEVNWEWIEFICTMPTFPGPSGSDLQLPVGGALRIDLDEWQGQKKGAFIIPKPEAIIVVLYGSAIMDMSLRAWIIVHFKQQIQMIMEILPEERRTFRRRALARGRQRTRIVPRLLIYSFGCWILDA
jgi:hypothetical protein